MLGKSIAGYELVEIIGMGGMGAVYKGLDEKSGREAAIKILPEEHSSNPEMVERFLREGGAGVLLNHPHIVKVYEVGEEEGTFFIAMEYVSGETLQEILGRGPLQQEQALSLIRQVTSALDHAHKMGVVHRDIKPANIMVTEEGYAKVMDFGLARITDLSALTETGDIMGTVFYISPEQATGGSVDAKSDLYSLGAVLYEMLTGTVPFQGESSVSVIYKHLNEEPLPLRSRKSDLSPSLEVIVTRLLQKDPSRRFTSAEELLQALERAKEAIETGVPLELPEEPKAPEFRFRLVGRDKELLQLKGHLEEAARGKGNLVLVSGEAGIGKTRLVEELASWARSENVNCLTGRCLYEEAPNPYLPFMEILQGYLDRREMGLLGDEGVSLRVEIDRLAQELTNLLPFAPLTTAKVEEPSPWLEAQARLFETLAQLLITISKERSLLLFLDDLQWASYTTLQLLHYLARSIRKSRILIVGTYRAEELRLPEAGHLLETMRRMSREELFSSMELQNLSQEDLGCMLQEIMIGETEDFVSLIYQETEGNPFFVLEVLRLLRDRGIFVAEEGKWRLAEEVSQLEIPPRIFDVIIRRVEMVGERRRDLLDWASVLGRRFRLELIVPLLGSSKLEVMKDLRSLEDTYQLIRSEDSEYRFAHPQIQEVLYRELTPNLRREYHLNIARCLEELYASNIEEVVYDLAHHYTRGEDKGKALVHSLAAASKAQGAFALEEALGYYGTARSILEERPTPENNEKIIDIRRQQAELLLTLGRRDEALESLNEALRMASELKKPPLEAGILIQTANVHLRKGEWEKAAALCEKSLNILSPTKDLRQMSQALSVMGTAIFLMGEPSKSLDYYEQALSLCEKSKDRVQAARLLGNIGNISHTQGEKRRAIDHYQKAIEILDREDRPSEVALGYLNLGYVYASLKEWDKAEECYERSLEIFQKRKDVYHTALTYHHLAECRLAQGEVPWAEDLTKVARELFQKINDPLGLADTDRLAAAMCKKEGDLGQAEGYLRRALETYESLGDKLNMAETHRELGLLLKETGKQEEGSAHLESANNLFKDLGMAE